MPAFHPVASDSALTRRFSRTVAAVERKYHAAMNLFQKLKSWWRGPADPESLAETADAQRLSTRRDTVIASQNTPARAPSSLLAAPTPDVLEPRDEDSTDSR